MKALAIDSAVSSMIISAKNDDKVCTTIYNIGMKQSETLVPAIEFVLSKTGIAISELDYTAITIGPGSFTGLRLAVSAVKSFELAYNIKTYGISSLEVYGYAFKDFDIPVISAIDAKKERFYARIFKNNKILLEDGDWEISEIAENLKSLEKVIISGPDSALLKEALLENGTKTTLLTPAINSVYTDALFQIAESKIAANEEPLKDYDGPVYLRASEAEVKLQQ